MTPITLTLPNVYREGRDPDDPETKTLAGKGETILVEPVRAYHLMGRGHAFGGDKDVQERIESLDWNDLQGLVADIKDRSESVPKRTTREDYERFALAHAADAVAYLDGAD